MKYELRLHRLPFSILAILLIAFIAILLRIHPALTDDRLRVAASLIIVILAAATFVLVGLMEGTVAFQFGRKHRREFLAYLLLGTVSLASGMYLALSDTASLQTVALVVAPHALLFGLAQLRIAAHLGRHPGLRRGFLLCGSLETVLGCALLAAWRFSADAVATLLGYVAVLSLLQLLPLLFASSRIARTAAARSSDHEAAIPPASHSRPATARSVTGARSGGPGPPAPSCANTSNWKPYPPPAATTPDSAASSRRDSSCEDTGTVADASPSCSSSSLQPAAPGSRSICPAASRTVR